MNRSLASAQTLSGSRIECSQREGELALYLPAQPWRMISQFGAFAFAIVLFLLFVTYLTKGWLPPIVMFGAMGALFISFAWASLANCYLRKAEVLIDAEKVVVTTSLYGREKTCQYSLDVDSRARQWYARRSTGGGSSPHPRGIEIGSNPNDAEKGSDPFDDTLARFGEGLHRGELDWLEWRINRFLESCSPNVDVADSPTANSIESNELSRPVDIPVSIEEGVNATRFVLPNTKETHTYAGCSTVLFGLGVVGASVFYTVHWWLTPPKHIPGPSQLYWLGLAVGVLFALLGVVGILNGLTRMFGRRVLLISPEVIRYRASLCGMPVWWTIATDEVVSAWSPGASSPVCRPRDVLPTRDCVIRTSTREVPLNAVQDAVSDASHAKWLATEIAWRIQRAKRELKQVRPTAS